MEAQEETVARWRTTALLSTFGFGHVREYAPVSLSLSLSALYFTTVQHSQEVPTTHPSSWRFEHRKRATHRTWAALTMLISVIDYYSFGPAATRALPAALPVNFSKFLIKRLAKSSALVFHSLALA